MKRLSFTDSVRSVKTFLFLIVPGGGEPEGIDRRRELIYGWMDKHLPTGIPLINSREFLHHFFFDLGQET